ncbi:MAG: hypothetical protein ABIP75_13145, partial [Pyrinomonadaceae bacterium]
SKTSGCLTAKIAHPSFEPARPLTRAVRLASPGSLLSVRLAANVLCTVSEKPNSRHSRNLFMRSGEASLTALGSSRAVSGIGSSGENLASTHARGTPNLILRIRDT